MEIAAQKFPLLESVDEVAEQSTRILDACNGSSIFGEFQVPEGTPSRTTDVLRLACNRTGLMIRSVLEISTVVDDLEHTRTMSQRYPWRGTEIKKSDHLKLVWFQYINLCYLYKERVRVFCNSTNDAAKLFGIAQRMDTSQELKRIESALGKYIRRRGQAFHEWAIPHAGIHLYAAIEILARAGHPRGAGERFYYSDAKWDLKSDVLAGLQFARAYYVSAMKSHGATVLEIVSKYDETYEAVRKGQRLVLG
jgi:hypothetical protein